MIETPPPWFAVQTTPTKEALADKFLREMGVTTYFPWSNKVWAGKVLYDYGDDELPVVRGKSKYLAELNKVAALTGYLFARAVADDIGIINGLMEGRLCRVVAGAGGEPCEIPEDIMAVLMASLGPTGRVYRNPPPVQVRQFAGQVGDEVRGAPGSLISGFIWQVTKICGEQVGLRLLNQMQQREISAHYTHVDPVMRRLA